MSVTFDRERGIFKLDTPHTSYVMGLADGKWLGHIYYGPRLAGTDLLWALQLESRPCTPETLPAESATFFDCFPQEYPAANAGDFRECCLGVRTARGEVDCLPAYQGYTVFPGKPALEGLPATFGGAEDCETLCIRLRDAETGIEAELLYTVFSSLDVITRSARITNIGSEPVLLERALSACLSLPYEGQQLITLPGAWARERAVQRQELAIGEQGVFSARGISSAQAQPFLALVSQNATQEHGKVWGMHLVYSGSFLAKVQRDQYDRLRAVIGIHPQDFCWKLEPGAAFQTPEAVLVCSDAGLGGMTRTLHDLYRNHLLRGRWRNQPRPVLINNWEATYFSFDEEKLLRIARRAAELNIELFVLDDGWFGRRNDDTTSLGDWQVNRAKLPHGLDGLARQINALGLRFGLWMEPEMVSPDSDLYRAHPDWVIRTANHAPLLCRSQLVLDLSRPEVEEYVWGQLAATLRSANISYLKWDMNRPLTNLGSAALPADRQGELGHRYVLALYRLQQRLLDTFPELLLENCASGGGRFDPGMLFYSPQIWCSDDTDAIERLRIQEGTALLYPLSCIGAHVSDCPNHLLGRVTPFETRGIVAMAGTFGYELDITRISEAEQQAIPGQIARYHQFASLIQSGDYYRLSSAESGLDAQLVVSKDRSEALLTLVHVLNGANRHGRCLRLQGLEPSAIYAVQGTGTRYAGDALLQLGLPVKPAVRDFQAEQVWLVRVSDR